MYVCHKEGGVPASNPLELVVNCLTWVLGTKAELSGRASALNCSAFSPATSISMRHDFFFPPSLGPNTLFHKIAALTK